MLTNRQKIILQLIARKGRATWANFDSVLSPLDALMAVHSLEELGYIKREQIKGRVYFIARARG